MQLTPNFSLEELTFSQTAARLGFDNTPNPAQQANLLSLCQTLLEPARIVLGVPLHVDSGFRSEWLNTQVGGAIDSAHLDGRAADIIPIGLDLHDAFLKLKTMAGLPIDQLIIECDAWLHLAIAPSGQQPRLQFLVASGGPGHWTYANG